MASYNNDAQKGDTAHLGPLVERLLAAFGLSHKVAGWRAVNKWPEIVGDQIARHSRAVRFSEDTILVVVEDAGYRQEYSMMVDDFLDKIHSLPGGKAVKKIHFISRERKGY